MSDQGKVLLLLVSLFLVLVLVISVATYTMNREWDKACQEAHQLGYECGKSGVPPEAYPPRLNISEKDFLRGWIEGYRERQEVKP